MAPRILSISTIAALTTGLAAQSFTTSPAGFTNAEANSNHDYILFKQDAMRWQQVDHTHRGTPWLMLGAAWRRDGTQAVDAAWIARTIGDFELIMAHVTPGQPILGNNLDATYADTPVTVVNPVNLSLPDWTVEVGTNPEPWTPTIIFDTPWTYNGVDDFVWEVRYSSGMNSARGNDYGNDMQLGVSATATVVNSTTGTALGTGCIAGGQTAPMSMTGSMTTYTDRFNLMLDTINAPANAPSVLWMDFSDPNLPLPGLCATLHSLGALQVGLGASDANGAIALDLDLGKSPVFINNTLYMQTLSLDGAQSGLPVSVSNGRSFVVPPDNYNCTRAYNYVINTGGSLITSGPWYGGIVIRFEGAQL